MDDQSICVCCGNQSNEDGTYCDRPHCVHCSDIHVQHSDEECHCQGDGIVRECEDN